MSSDNGKNRKSGSKNNVEKRPASKKSKAKKAVEKKEAAEKSDAKKTTKTAAVRARKTKVKRGTV